MAAARADDLAPTVTRVYPGPDGKLVYVPDEQGNTISDCSHAGYGGGGVPIPTVPVKETIWPVAGDNTAHVQAAIDKVSALPLDRNGFRGAVLLRAGLLQNGNSGDDPGQRRGAARRRHGRHRHDPHRHGHRPYHAPRTAGWRSCRQQPAHPAAARSAWGGRGGAPGAPGAVAAVAAASAAANPHSSRSRDPL